MSSCVILLGLLLQDPALDATLEAAMKAAARRVAPSIVQIQTVGGAERLGRGDQAQQRGQGPTTGVIVTADGFIISSSYNFLDKPAAITVQVPGRTEPLPARVVAQDHTRMLTLLKIEAEELPVPEAVPADQMRLGQWSMALGRSWSGSSNSEPSISVGIISALGRIWGKAIQTDAKVSPVNYGGPLIDLQGRILGILVPLSPRGEDGTAGVEWYDGGIGFAIPLTDVLKNLPKLRAGESLRKGVLGAGFKGGFVANAPALVEQVEADGPAAKAGMQAGDEIIAFDDQAISRQAQVLHHLGPKYAGEEVRLKVKRDGQEVPLPAIKLTAPAAGHALAWLGLLALRDEARNDVAIRYVFPESPAAKAELKPGDRIVAVEGRPIGGRDDLMARLATVRPGMNLKIAVRRKGETKVETLTVETSRYEPRLPEGELGAASAKEAKKPKPTPLAAPGRAQPAPRPAAPAAEPAEKEVPKGFIERRDEALGRSHWLYVPEKYDPNISHALVIWLHPAGATLEEEMKSAWKSWCDQNHIILLAPRADDPNGWLTSEMDGIAAEIRALQRTYTIDRQRVVAHGLGNGASFALALGFDARDSIRGVAAVGGLLARPPQENEAGQRLSFYLVVGARDPDVEVLRGVQPQLAEKKFPVLFREIPDLGTGYLPNAAELERLVLWIESLDRF